MFSAVSGPRDLGAAEVPQGHDFKIFMIYRLAVAALVLSVIALGIRPAGGL